MPDKVGLGGLAARDHEAWPQEIDKSLQAGQGNRSASFHIHCSQHSLRAHGLQPWRVQLAR